MLSSSCSLLYLNSDDDFQVEFDRTRNLLVIVEQGVAPALEDELDIYRVDLASDGINVRVMSWTGGNAADLREYISQSIKNNATDSVFLVGSMPAAWYEQYASKGNEEFPCDLYLMDPECVWEDGDSDGIFDKHSEIKVRISVSRVIGSSDELTAYFGKLHAYRTGDLSLPVGAYLFKDDDWYDFQTGSSFGLSRIYSNVAIDENPPITLRDKYFMNMTGASAEFVNQWIHSYPSALFVQEDSRYSPVTTLDIGNRDLRGLFYNLFDCSAARFTEENLGMTYLVRTNYALAVFGSTKVGGSYQSLIFYDVLSKRGTWGDAYKTWYNRYGKRSDSWFLGMVILGDPALMVTTTGVHYRAIDMSLPVEPDATWIKTLEDTFWTMDWATNAGNYSDYRAVNPSFFGK
ncbi:MAG: hypothetical protein EHM28_01780 [Spirochaetaceae bacterium]|nr:MAG: hypothetical protein EHM28_01780 [Spirochaetaceae bacterium]